ncbi:tyrosine-type recombinase/integrase [Sulfobacillus sp. hq2]|uniref:tyrosine-type recombinase/integrase n=1 Tax=Sulfobacillus sp. hq2 TaxID=2039167 RepID=UPI000CD06E2C|nr:tyrosine-type recombinase/integrase [Sulfobacillus sp. hq2]POB09495.1 site-specific integrase [Sulfobacillus sp. hq2]
MAGQIISRGDRTWLIRIFIGRDPKTGKRKYLNKTVHGTKKEAQQELNALLRDQDTGTLVTTQRITLNEYLDQWLEAAAKPRLRPQTSEDYKAILNRYVRQPLGYRRLSTIQPLDLQKLYSEMLERGLSPRTIRYTHVILSSALKQAVRWQMLSQNPADKVSVPKQQRREMHALNPEETKRFLSAAESSRWLTLFQFALVTGMRPEEYFGLRWEDIDWHNGRVQVKRVLVRPKGGGWRFDEPKTKKGRSIPIPQTLVASLKTLKVEQAKQRLSLGERWKDHGLVFTAENGEPIHHSNFTARHFKPILKAAGLAENIRLYDLRHTCATLLLVAGENPKVVSERLGHASITLTLDTYSHVLPTLQQQATSKLESLLFGNGTQVGTL